MTLLHLDQVGRRYGGLHALHPITLDIAAGSRHAVIGANGAGKSTLLHLIAGTVRPTGGRITLDGHDITSLRPAQRARRGVARTWQHPAVFHRLPVAANVALALTRHTGTGARLRLIRRHDTVARAHAVLAAAGLAAHAEKLAGQLPYGLRRRLDLTLALATQPRLLLLDEPSAGLDPDETAHLVATIRELPTDTTVLLVDHHLDLIWDVADTVTVLHHGHHLTTGTPTTVRAHPDVQAAYLTTTTGRPAGPTTTPTTHHGDHCAPLLRVRGLNAGYHGATVLHELKLDLPTGRTVAVLGRNGAGKTTLLNTLAGLHPTTSGIIELAGNRLPRRPHRVAAAGVVIVPQGRRLFDLTVAEHLTLAESTARRRAAGGHRWTRDDVLTVFPPLRGRLLHHAAHLSGGEQQMLAIARALLARPKMLLLDEPSEGLAPAITDQLASAMTLIAAHGVTIVLAEQHLPLAVHVADRVVVLDRGRVAFDVPADALNAADTHRRLHSLLGVAPAGSSA